MDYKKIFSKKFLWIVFGVFLFFIYSQFFYFGVVKNANEENFIFNWPDEMSTSFFVKNFSDNNSFRYFEPLNKELLNTVHPRSTNVNEQGEIVPTAFLGFGIVLGLVSKVVGFYLAHYLTPLLAVLALFFLFKITERFFNHQIAIITVLLSAFFAPFFYFSSFVMLPNIAFIFFMLGGLWFFETMTRHSFWRSFGSGIFLGTAIIIRPSESIFLLLLIMVIYFINHQKINPKQLYLCAIGVVFPILILLFYNFQSYGDIFQFGYLKMDTGLTLVEKLPGEVLVSSPNPVWGILELLFVPFGFHPRLIWHNFWEYSFSLTWFFWLLIVLIPFFVKKSSFSEKKIGYFLWVLISWLWLHCYYGSWQIIDPIVLQNNYLSISYIRYFLPAYLLLIPLSIWGLNEMFAQINLTKTTKRIITGFFISFFILYNLQLVFFSSHDGLSTVKQELINYRQIYNEIEKTVPAKAIIIIDNADKMLWPRFSVIPFGGNLGIFQKIKASQVLKEKQIFYLTFGSEEKLNSYQEDLTNLGFYFIKKEKIVHGYTLFELKESVK